MTTMTTMTPMPSEAAILIPISTLLSFSKPTRLEVFTGLGIAGYQPLDTVPLNDAEPIVAGSGPPDFTVAMARKLIAEPINSKTLGVLRAIAESPTPTFRNNYIIASVTGVTKSSELRGAWAGITRRSRNILADPVADPVWWGEELNDGDFIGRVSDLTHQSLRTALSISDDE